MTIKHKDIVVAAFERKADVCNQARAWLLKQRGTPEQVWNKCPRGTWLNWLLMEFNIEYEEKRVAWAATMCRIDTGDECYPPFYLKATKYNLKIDRVFAEEIRKRVKWATIRRQLKP